MRKQCTSCGFITFISDESCKRCGSPHLVITPGPGGSPAGDNQPVPGSLPFTSYLKCFSLAVLIEVIALASFLPALAEQMMRHSARASRTQMEIVSEGVASVLHLPTILIMWPLTVMTDSIIVWLTPVTQIIFWTVLFTSIARRRRAQRTGA